MGEGRGGHFLALGGVCNVWSAGIDLQGFVMTQAEASVESLELAIHRSLDRVVLFVRCSDGRDARRHGIMALLMTLHLLRQR